jgi:hypothetical protein
MQPRGANQMTDTVGHNLGELGQRCYSEHRCFGFRHEAEKKRAILQGIGCIFDFVDHRPQHAGFADTGGNFARRYGQAIGLLFEPLGPLGEGAPFSWCNRTRRGEDIGDAPARIRDNPR